MNLHTIFPSLPFRVKNYRTLCALLGEIPASGNNSRVSHMNHWRKFFSHFPVVEGGKKKHLIDITEILNPNYVGWIPYQKLWAHDSSLLTGHYLSLSIRGDGPSPMANQMQTFVATTSSLTQLLGLGTRKASKWRRGQLEVEVSEDDQIKQFDKFHSYIYDVIHTVISSQLFLEQFCIVRTWLVEEPNAVSTDTWRFATYKEEQQLLELFSTTLAGMGLKTRRELFWKRKEAEFYGMFVEQLRSQLPPLHNALQVWHIKNGEGEELSFEDMEELLSRQNKRIIEWASGRGIDPEIIEKAIAQWREG